MHGILQNSENGYLVNFKLKNCYLISTIMKKLVILQFDGDFSTGYKVTLEVGDDGERPDVRMRGDLPPALDVVRSIQEWRKIYVSKYGQSRIKVNAVKNINTVDYKQQCDEYSEQLLSLFNTWLESESFNSISNYLSKFNTNQEQELRIILSSDSLELRKLPWHLWDLCSGAEVALSAPDAARGVRILREKIRILIILGDSTGINVKADEMLLQKYCRDAEIVTLVEPSREDLNRYLQDDIGWDILFFSGHSQTHNFTDAREEVAVQGRIFVNKKDSLTMAELRDSLQTAIQQRLQLAIFNSCDGLGIAAELESLQIPQVIVMREPVPDLVAQEFLKYFLEAFTNGRSLCIAVGYARRQLALLEDDFPCASWLPVIVQNQLEMPPTWQSLGVTRSPYRGLMAFREEDADNFFGREAFIEQLVIDVNRKPLVAVIGASGSGKSSVVFAGLIPQLRRDENTQWRIICFRPGKNPFESLAVALMGSEEIGENQRYQELELEVELKSDISALARIIADMSADGSRVLLVIDQFEEIYTLCSKVEDRQIFIDGLLNVCTGEVEKQEDKQPFPLTVTVVMTLRADFLGKAMSYQPLGKALQDFPPSLLVPMSRAELERAIIQPAARYSVELEEGLVDKLIDDVGSGEGSLPLQQFALTQLWGKQRPGLLTHQAYTEIGGVTQALANHAEAVYAGLSGEQQKRAQRVFIQLVQPGEGTEDTRRLATRDEVGDYWDLVTLLANERLLVTNRNELVEDTVEVVHEALIRNWGRLRGWMDDNRQFRVWQERLKVALQQWVDSNKDDGGLLRGATLAVAEDCLKLRGEEVSKPQRWFIEKGVELRERERKQKDRLRRSIVAGLVCGLLVISGFAAVSEIRRTDAEIGRLSGIAEKYFAGNYHEAALIEAIKAGKMITGSIWKPWIGVDTKMLVILTLQDLLNNSQTKILKGYKSRISDASFSPDGKIIATVSEDKIVRIWDVDTGNKIRYLGDNINNISLNPDGKTIATVSEDKIVKIWDVDTGREIRTFPVNTHLFPCKIAKNLGHLETSTEECGRLPSTVHVEKINGISFSHDGQTLGIALDYGIVKVLNIKSGREINTLFVDITLNGNRFTLSSHGDGMSMSIGLGSKDSQVKFFDTKSGKEFDLIKGFNHIGCISSAIFFGDEVYRFSFSPNGRIFIINENHHTSVFKTNNGSLIKELDIDYEGSKINKSYFSPDSNIIASIFDNHIVKLWDINSAKKITTIHDYTDNILSANFSSDGKNFAYLLSNDTVILRNIDLDNLMIQGCQSIRKIIPRFDLIRKSDLELDWNSWHLCDDIIGTY